MAALDCGMVEMEESQTERCGGDRQWAEGKQREKGRARHDDGGHLGSDKQRWA
jgi:hypothetical protein